MRLLLFHGDHLPQHCHIKMKTQRLSQCFHSLSEGCHKVVIKLSLGCHGIKGKVALGRQRFVRGLSVK